jgi:hypothetical protein
MNSTRFGWLKPLLRAGLSWAVFLWGIAVGLLFTTRFADTSPASAGTTESAVVGVGVLGVCSLLASILALRSRRHAARVFLLAAPIVVVCVAWFWLRHHDGSISFPTIVLFVIGAAAFLVLPGVFWLITSRRGWPPLIGTRKAPARQPLLLNALLLLFLVFGCTVASVCFFSFESCNEVLPPVSVQSSPMQAVFTGRILLLALHPFHDEPHFVWAAVRVDHVYWGLPVWMCDFVLVRGYFNSTDDGQQYFVDAHRSRGVLTRFLPVLENYPCCHTTPVKYAEVDLRVLQDGPPKLGGRIIGRLWRLRPPGRSELVANEPVAITGPTGTVSTATDSDGIFDFRDLPPGHYSIYIDSRYYGGTDLKVGDVWGGDLWLRPSVPHDD